MFALELHTRRFDDIRVAEAVEHDVRAVRGERCCDSETDTARRAGDDSRFSVEHEILRIALCRTRRAFVVRAPG